MFEREAGRHEPELNLESSILPKGHNPVPVPGGLPIFAKGMKLHIASRNIYTTFKNVCLFLLERQN